MYLSIVLNVVMREKGGMYNDVNGLLIKRLKKGVRRMDPEKMEELIAYFNTEYSTQAYLTEDSKDTIVVSRTDPHGYSLLRAVLQVVELE